MASEIGILSIEQDGTDGLIVTFTDGTLAGYVVEELLSMRPYREHVVKSDAVANLMKSGHNEDPS
jgi:hypothetical protein